MALRDADRHKDEFLSMLAHELRNPLTPISLATHILEQPGLDDEQHRWAVATIAGRVEHITRLVDDLLDVSRISRGRIALKRDILPLDDLVENTVASMRPVIEAKNHHFALNLPDRPVYLNADPVRLTQVLTNILDNAAKYTPKGGHIDLTAMVVGQEVEISVRDDGMGMPAELIPHVFELFQQGERTLDRSQGGLGIGMSLAERLVKLHGGRIKADGAGPGQGSRFTLWLPIVSAGPPVVAEPPGAPAAAGNLRVLLVDDERLIAMSLGKMLTLHGYIVDVAHSGAEALAHAPQFQPQAILLDIGMPGMDGYETARRLRELPGGADFRLVAVSGYGDEAAQAQSRAAGFDSHLTKPVNYQRLAAELDLAVARGK
jgi:CheY-like chemotaxis protein/two-component sensor histidine kinase